MRKFLAICALVLLAWPASADVRIKDIAAVDGVRGNQIYGFGLVVGLDGTGDSSNSQFTFQMLISFLKKMNITAGDKVDVKNCAGVFVTAELPPFVKPGSRIDVTISSMGNCKSLQGGTLVMTPLHGPDGIVYAVAQGPVSVGGFGAAAGGASTQKNHPTVGAIPNGAIIEEEVPMHIMQEQSIRICLKNPDFTTANRMAESINALYQGSSMATDPGSVEVKVPQDVIDRQQLVPFIAAIEQVQLKTDAPAKVIVNERTGTIIAGENVNISTVAIAHGSLVITIREKTEVTQPQVPLAGGETVVTQQQELDVEEKQARLIVLQESISIKDVANALNAIGVSPRDMISIFQAMKRADALKADLEVM